MSVKNNSVVLPSHFYLPPPATQKLRDEDSTFYKSFRIKHTNINNLPYCNTHFGLYSPEKNFSYASYLIKMNNSKSLKFIVWGNKITLRILIFIFIYAFIYFLLEMRKNQKKTMISVPIIKDETVKMKEKDTKAIKTFKIYQKYNFIQK